MELPSIKPRSLRVLSQPSDNLTGCCMCAPGPRPFRDIITTTANFTIFQPKRTLGNTTARWKRSFEPVRAKGPRGNVRETPPCVSIGQFKPGSTRPDNRRGSCVPTPSRKLAYFSEEITSKIFPPPPHRNVLSEENFFAEAELRSVHAAGQNGPVSFDIRFYVNFFCPL